MTPRVRTRSAWLVVAVMAVAGYGLPICVAADDQLTATGTSSIEGKIKLGESKAPVGGATVLAYHLATATIFRSEPTGADGHFEITGLAHGYYDMAVEAPDGLYVGNEVVNVPPDGNAVSDFNLQPTGPGQSGPRDFPGSGQPASGIASTVDKSFWLKPKGIAIWAGGSAAAIALAVGLGNDSDNATVSCSVPPCP